MVAAPVLHLPDFTQEFVIEMDPSNEGIGVVLMQQGHSICWVFNFATLQCSLENCTRVLQ